MFRGAIAKATFSASAVLGVRLIAQAGCLLLIANLLGPEDFGTLTGLMALALMLGSLSTFGSHFQVLAEVSKSPTQNPASLPGATSTTFLLGTILLGLYLVVTMFMLGTHLIASTTLIAIGITHTLLHPLLYLPAVQHQGRGHIGLSQAVLTLPFLLRLIVAGAIWHLEPDNPLDFFVFGCLLSAIIALAFASLSMKNAWPNLWALQLPCIMELRASAGYALTGLTAYGPGEMDKIIAVKFMTPASAGLYAIAMRIAGTATLPIIALMVAATPKLFKGNIAQIKPLANTIFLASLAYSVLLGIALWQAAPLFLLVFGTDYQSVSTTIKASCLVIPGICLRIAAGSTLIALDKPWLRSAIEVFGMLFLAFFSLTADNREGWRWLIEGVGLAEYSMALIGWLAIYIHHRREKKASSTKAES